MASLLADGERAEVVSLATKCKDAYTEVGQPGEVRAASYFTSGTAGEDVLGGGGLSLLDKYAITARTSDSCLVAKSNRRIRRFYQRYFAGIEVGGQLRILTLTTSDEAKGLDIHKAFRVLKERLRRRWGQFEYIGVKERKSDREHLHLVFRGSYMEQSQISAMWQDIYQSKVVDIRLVYKQRGGVRYLAKYLGKAMCNRYWASYGWVFKGWVGWSKFFKRVVGHFPSKGLLTCLARLDNETRKGAMVFLLRRYALFWDLIPAAGLN
jgi:hypothetical protein